MNTNTVSSYDQQAETFLASNGIKFRATLSDSKQANWEPSGHHYRVTLSKKGNRLTFDFWGCRKDVDDEHKNKSDRARLYNEIAVLKGKIQDAGHYFPGREARNKAELAKLQPILAVKEEELVKALAFSPKGVSAYDVLACISGDVNCAETFKDFCDEMGEDQDSIKALQTFRRCSRFAKRLQEFFTPSEIEALQEIQ